MEPVVRLYAPNDRAAVIAALVALQAREAELSDARLPGSSALPYLDALLVQHARRSGALFVAELDGTIVGVAACVVLEEPSMLEPPDSIRFGVVTDVYVDPDRRQRGIARRLLEAAERHLAAAGVTRMRIGLLAGNEDARRTYERCGFAPYEVILEKRIG
jgi:GNAT superfamily N-acetyltransferase